MLKRIPVVLVLMTGRLTVGCSLFQPPAYIVDTPPQMFDDMGPYQRAITTSSPEAQQYFDQGLTWAYAFNHDEAIRSFTKAAELDPTSAMPWWGIAYCQGPNYNDTMMTEERSQGAWDAIQNALANIDNTTPVERDLIEAMATRYAKPWPPDRTALDVAYADAMESLWQKYPADPDVGTIYADSLMVQMPWMLYDIDYKPAPNTPKVEAALTSVLEMAPNHPGANHLYIHAVEPSANPARGLAAATRLGDMVPASGHLLHMPSHIYVNTGHWHDAIVQNVKAMKSDDGYQKLSPKQTVQWMYMVHNAHMLAFAAMMSGREKEGLAAARDMWHDISPDDLKRVGPYFDYWMCSVYDVLKRFGRWDALLAEPAPPSYLPITKATWRAARAVAYAAKKDFKNAEREYSKFKWARATLPANAIWGPDKADKVLEVADYFVAGEIALQKEEWEEAAELLEKGVEIERSLAYGEPPQWLQPTRHTLGAVYLKSEKYADAERVYRADLEKWPNNGWSLYGLSKALRAQGKTAEADKYDELYRQAWSRADEPIDTSCKCIPGA